MAEAPEIPATIPTTEGRT